jgi:hypothetical protein
MRQGGGCGCATGPYSLVGNGGPMGNGVFFLFFPATLCAEEDAHAQVKP